MPGDGLALAVLVSGQQEFVGVLEQLLELADLLPLVGVDDVERLEIVIHVHAEASPGLASQYFVGISAALSGISRIWPMLDSTV